MTDDAKREAGKKGVQVVLGALIDGIYYREDPAKLRCKGHGGTHAADR